MGGWWATSFPHLSHARGGEIGYVFHPDVTGQGYATEGCSAVLDLAFDKAHGLGLHRVIARMDARNVASARLRIAWLGMRREAHHRRSQMLEREWADLVIYALLEREWRTRSSAPAGRPGYP